MKTRRFRITAFIDVPFDHDLHFSENELEALISKRLSGNGITVDYVEASKQPLDEIHDYYGDDLEDITEFEHPVGFIAPDGKFYGCESSDFSLAHIALAEEVWEHYKDVVSENNPDCKFISTGKGLDFDLEHWGFIKVRDGKLHYYTNSENVKYWTDAQVETVYKYIKHYCDTYKTKFPLGDWKTKRVTASQFKQMDKFAILECFGLV